MSKHIVITGEGMLDHTILTKDLLIPEKVIRLLDSKYLSKSLSDYQAYICERINSPIYRKKKISTATGTIAYLYTYIKKTKKSA